MTTTGFVVTESISKDIADNALISYGPQRLKKALIAILPHCKHISETNGTSIAPALSFRKRSIGHDNPSPILTSTPLTPLSSGFFNSNGFSKQTERPRALLVEDNAINLKVRHRCAC